MWRPHITEKEWPTPSFLCILRPRFCLSPLFTITLSVFCEKLAVEVNRWWLNMLKSSTKNVTRNLWVRIRVVWQIHVLKIVFLSPKWYLLRPNKNHETVNSDNSPRKVSPLWCVYPNDILCGTGVSRSTYYAVYSEPRISCYGCFQQGSFCARVG
jgi:hypothetical protein